MVTLVTLLDERGGPRIAGCKVKQHIPAAVLLLSESGLHGGWWLGSGVHNTVGLWPVRLLSALLGAQLGGTGSRCGSI